MPTLVAGIVAILIAYVVITAFRKADPRIMARLIKSVGGILALALAAWLGVRGQLLLAVPLGIFGLGLLGWAPFDGRLGTFIPGLSGGTGRLRAAFVELDLDRRSGAMTGRILRGPFQGRALDSMSLQEFSAAHAGMDADSRTLLEAYLDRRFPGWRDHVQADTAAGPGRRSAGHKMTEEEAYQILGLQPGASRGEISRAHRSLMKKLHPDQGGSTYLAARVNEAKDLLIRTHRN